MHANATPLRRCKNSMENSPMSLWWWARDLPALQLWRPCWPLANVVLTARMPPLLPPTLSYNGGPNASSNPKSGGPSAPLPHTPISRLSQMQAPVSESASSLGRHGVRTASNQTGKRRAEASPGQKRSASSSSPGHLFFNERIARACAFMGTTELSLKAGDTARAETSTSTRSLPVSSISAKNRVQRSPHVMSSPPRTPQTARRVASHSVGHTLSPRPHRAYSRASLNTSPSRQQSAARPLPRPSLPQRQKAALPSLSRNVDHPNTTRQNQSNEARPPVLAQHQLLQWKPHSAIPPEPNPGTFQLPLADQSAVAQVLSNAWQESTLRVYGGGLMHYHLYCDTMRVPEAQRTPCSPDLLAGFITSLTGAYASSTISNYVAGVQAWHRIHRLPWRIDKKELALLLRAADRLAPHAATQPLRLPYTVRHIEMLYTVFDLSKPRDAAVWACLTTAFYSCARLGEFTVPSTAAFCSTHHITPANVREDSDRQGNRVFVFHLPRSKTAPRGEDVTWAAQHGHSDPLAAFQAHLLKNFPPVHSHLFAYQHQGSFRPLTKRDFLDRIAAAAREAGLPQLHGHSIRIGATLEYLLRGVSFEAVKLIGRWRSDAFRAYLRKHAQVLAPYLQASPDLHAQLQHLIAL